MSHAARELPRVGIINLMPRAEVYQQTLLSVLSAAEQAFEPCFVRLHTHAYHSSDHAHIEHHYRPFDRVWAEGELAGLIITGAPVEELAFQDVTYWTELCEIIDFARERVPSTLGLCWGGLALAQRLGIEKANFPRKLFGVFPLRNLAPEHPALAGAGEPVLCPQSRHSGIPDSQIEAGVARGEVRPLAHSQAAGYAIFESADGRFLAHLGHPEYEPERLLFEYERDRAAARSDVSEPFGVDLARPSFSWRAHQRSFFGGWLGQLALR